jgi:SET domain-containing protein
MSFNYKKYIKNNPLLENITPINEKKTPIKESNDDLKWLIMGDIEKLLRDFQKYQKIENPNKRQTQYLKSQIANLSNMINQLN